MVHNARTTPFPPPPEDQCACFGKVLHCWFMSQKTWEILCRLLDLFILEDPPYWAEKSFVFPLYYSAQSATSLTTVLLLCSHTKYVHKASSLAISVLLVHQEFAREGKVSASASPGRKRRKFHCHARWKLDFSVLRRVAILLHRFLCKPFSPLPCLFGFVPAPVTNRLRSAVTLTHFTKNIFEFFAEFSWNVPLSFVVQKHIRTQTTTIVYTRRAAHIPRSNNTWCTVTNQRPAEDEC